MKQKLLNTFFLTLLSLSISVSAQDVPAVGVTNQQSVKPYQIFVSPTFKRSDIRDLIVKLEEDFVARFNELNIDDDYDVLCYDYTPTMSHISRRTCEPNFLIRTRAGNASEAAYLLRQPGDPFSKIFVLTPRMLRQEVHGDYEILQSKLEELTSSDEDLKAMAMELDKLSSRMKNFGKDD